MTIEIDPRIIAARSQMLVEEPFWGTLAMHLKVQPNQGCTTMAVDGVTLFYNPDYPNREGMGMKQIKRSWKHEVLHCSLGHIHRRNGRDPRRWNIACDHVVNIILKKAGEEIPPQLYCDMRFDGFSAEQIYRILEDEERQQQQPEPQDQDPDEDEAQDQAPQPGEDEGDDDAEAGGDQDDGDPGEDDAEEDGDAPADDEGDDQQGQGSGSGDDADGDDEQAGGGNGGAGDDQGQIPGPQFNGDPGDCGEVLDAPATTQAGKDEIASEWEIATQQAVNVARRHGEGKVPGFVEAIINNLNEPKVSPRDVLRRFVDPISTTKDYTWSAPSRRMLGLDYYVPGFISDGIHHIAFVVDSSGSMDDRILADVGGWVQCALDEGGIDKVTLVFCDTRVTKTGEYVKGETIDFTVPGRGGTNFSPAFAWLDEHAPDIAAAVYLTDLDCSDFGPEPSYPVLWCGYGNPLQLERLMARVPWGECIDVQS